MRQENNLHNHRIPIYVLITLENGLVRRLPRFIAMSIFFFVHNRCLWDHVTLL